MGQGYGVTSYLWASPPLLPKGRWILRNYYLCTYYINFHSVACFLLPLLSRHWLYALLFELKHAYESEITWIFQISPERKHPPVFFSPYDFLQSYNKTKIQYNSQGDYLGPPPLPLPPIVINQFRLFIIPNKCSPFFMLLTKCQQYWTPT